MDGAETSKVKRVQVLERERVPETPERGVPGHAEPEQPPPASPRAGTALPPLTPPSAGEGGAKAQDRESGAVPRGHMEVDETEVGPGKHNAKKKLFGVPKRDHQPSGETPYPPDKVQLVPAKVQGCTGPHDRAPHAGYDLCAPLQGGRFAHWKPGKMPLPPDVEQSQSAGGENPEIHQESGTQPWLSVGRPTDNCWVVAGLGPADLDHCFSFLGRRD